MAKNDNKKASDKDKKKKTTAKKKNVKKTTPKKKTTKSSTAKATTSKKKVTKKATPKTTPKKKTTKSNTQKKKTIKRTTPKKNTTPKKKITTKEKEVVKNKADNLEIENKEKLETPIEELKIKEKKKPSKKIKTKFTDDLLDELENETLVNEAFTNEEETASNDKNYISEEEIEILSKVEENKTKEEELLEEEINYNGFVIRLIVLVLILILSIFFVIKFCVKYINTSPMKDVSYFESSDVSYTLCTNDDCNMDNIVSSSINKASIKFNYNVNFDEKVGYKVKYKIIEKLNITSSNGIAKSITKDVLSKEVKGNRKTSLNLEEEISTDIEKYRKELDEYNEKNEGDHTGTIIVALKVDGISNEKEVANVKIPLAEEKVQTSIISSNVSDSLFRDDTMNNYSNVYVILFGASLLVVICSCVGIVVLINNADIKVGE